MGEIESPARRAVREVLQVAGARLYADDGAELLADSRATDILILEGADRDAAIKRLVAEAPLNIAAFDAATRLATWLEELGDRIPAALQPFVAGAERGTLKRPRRRGPKPYKLLVRDEWIIDAILAGLRADPELRPMHNDAPQIDLDTGEDAPRHSACSIVSECLIEVGISLGYDGVKAIWKRHARWRRGTREGTRP